MEDLSALLEMLKGLHPAIPIALAGLGTLVVLGQTVVLLTPSKADDAWLAKLDSVPLLGSLLKALRSFAPLQKK